VGSGPFPTELFDEVGQHLATRGHEFGSTTGRARRCGWFDAVALRRARITNGISGLCVTKLDVLDGMDEIQLCVGYQTAKGPLQFSPTGAEALAEVEPIYETMPGWRDSTLGVTDHAKLPANAQRYLARSSEVVESPIDIISTGPDRAQTIILRHPFA
jgi:adenylosuccinate synthase